MAESARIPRGSITHETAVSRARETADRVLTPAAAQNDKAGRFSTEAVDALGQAGLLGLMVPAGAGGSGLGPRTFAAVMATLAEADASVAMVYLMHVLGAATISAARPEATTGQVLSEIAAGRHLSTLAFSEAGSRSHFWAPVSRARRNGSGVSITATKSWVTSAGHAQSYIVSSLAPDGENSSQLNLYLIPASAPGFSVAGPWDGMRPARAGETLRCAAAQRNPPDYAIVFRDPPSVEEAPEFVGFGISRDGRGQAHAQAVGTSLLDALPGAHPCAGASCRRPLLNRDIATIIGWRIQLNGSVNANYLPAQNSKSRKCYPALAYAACGGVEEE